MKPSFALDFRDGLVTLLHRTSRGWSRVGSAAFDAPDLVEALGYLRATALGLSPRGITTKLIIPNEQVLYTEVHAPGPEPVKRRRQILAALEGLTPYALDDLVYDWWGTGADVQVAVLAKQTLAEAEAFAHEHRFNPVSFVAVPDNAAYLGEPFFGASSLSATLLATGEKVERDSDPVTVVARDFPKAEPVTPSPAVAEPAAPQEAQAEAAVAAPAEAPVAEPAPVAAPEVARPADPAPDAQSRSEAASPAVPEPPVLRASAPQTAPQARTVVGGALPDLASLGLKDLAQPKSNAPQGFAPPAADPKPKPEAPLPLPQVAVEPKASDPEAAAPHRRFAPQAPRPPEAEAKRQADVPEAPMALDVAGDAAPVAEADRPAAPAADIVAAFASRRTAASAAATPGTAKPAASGEAPIPPVGPAPSQRPTVARPALAKPVANLAPVPAKPTPTAARPAPTKPGKPLAPSVTAPGILGAKRERNVVAMISAADGKAPGTAKAAAKPLTGLGSRPAVVKGKPAYLGLILTAILLVALVAVAIWSSWSLGTNDATGTGAGTPPAADQASIAAPATPETTIADATIPETAPPETATAEAVTADSATNADVAPISGPTVTASTANAGAPLEPASDLPSATDEVRSDARLIAPDATSPVPDPVSQTATVAEAVPPASEAAGPLADVQATDTASPDTATPDAAAPALEPAPQTEVSTAGAVPATQGNDAQDEIFLASADTPPTTSDPITLPALGAAADGNPAAAPPPPPFGTVYKFDADGRIIPTPEGIMTPEGVLLIAGKPAQVPPARPADATLATSGADATADLATIEATGAAAELPLTQDPTLVGKRPQDRPADLTPTVDQQGTAPADAPDSRFASLRPQARPADPAAAVLPPDDLPPANEGASASLAANGFALTTSLIPPARPALLTDAVDDAVASALQDPAPDLQTASANTAPEAQAEPEVESAAPSLPTNASVAKQATEKNALATNRVALLAVFGTASSRFAMIRQANGTVTKVKIGDTIDGGRIAGITANAVQYQKGGQIVTLSLPTG